MYLRNLFSHVGDFSQFLLQTVSLGRRKFSADFQLVFRLIKGLIFLTFVSILIILIAIPHMTMKDIIVCILAFMPSGWGILLVSIACHISNSENILFCLLFKCVSGWNR